MTFGSHPGRVRRHDRARMGEERRGAGALLRGPGARAARFRTGPRRRRGRDVANARRDRTQAALLDALACCRAGVAAARRAPAGTEGDDEAEDCCKAVIADAHFVWAQAHVAFLEMLAADERAAPPAATLAVSFRGLLKPDESPELVEGLRGGSGYARHRRAFRAALGSLRQSARHYVLDGHATPRAATRRGDSRFGVKISTG